MELNLLLQSAPPSLYSPLPCCILQKVHIFIDYILFQNNIAWRERNEDMIVWTVFEQSYRLYIGLKEWAYFPTVAYKVVQQIWVPRFVLNLVSFLVWLGNKSSCISDFWVRDTCLFLRNANILAVLQWHLYASFYSSVDWGTFLRQYLLHSLLN